MREAKNITVLVVDDETSLRKPSCSIYEEKGYNVVAQKNGLQAINYKKPENWLVLTDVSQGDGVGCWM